jgi:hypothetical protein
MKPKQSLEFNSVLRDLKDKIRPILDIADILSHKTFGENNARARVIFGELIALDSLIEEYIVEYLTQFDGIQSSESDEIEE